MKKRNLLKVSIYLVSTILISLCFINPVKAQPNLGFEYNSFRFWRCYYDGGINQPTSNGVINTTDSLLFKGATYYKAAAATPYQVITTGTGTDIYGKYPVVCPFPGSGKHSAKLGDDQNMSTAQGIIYNVKIPANQNKYKVIVYYAIDMEDPGAHSCWEMPLFSVNAYDSANKSKVIPCSKVSVDICSVKNNPTLSGQWHASKTLSPNGDSVFYTSWTPLTLIAKNMGGRTLSLEFMSAGCSPGGFPGIHFGYAYVDFDTIQTTTKDTVMYCPHDSCLNFSPLPGYKAYQVYDSATHTLLAIDTNPGQSPVIPLCGKFMPKPKTKLQVLLTPYSGFGCADTIYYYVDTFPTHILPPIKSPQDSICAGSNMTLTDATAGGTWVSDSTKYGSIGANTGVFTSISSGTDLIEYRAKNIWGCPDTTLKTIVVGGLRVAAINGKNGVCVGDTIHLSDSTAGGTWVSSNTSIATVNNGIITGLAYGTVTITYSFANNIGCAGTVTKNLQVGIPPLTAITGSSILCSNHTDTLANATAGGTWISTNPAIATIGANTGIVNGISSGLDTIKYLYAFGGCSDSVIYPITVNAAAAAPIVGDTIVCQRHTITLNNPAAGGNWISVSPSVATITNQGVLSGLTTGIDTIKYIIVSSNGCADSTFSVIKVNPTPTAAPIVGINNICFGKTATFTDTTANGVWFSLYPNIASISSTGIVTANSPGATTIKYIIVNQFGCSDSAAFPVTVNPKPSIGSIAGNDSFCIRVRSQFADVTNSGVWTTTNPSIASIDSITGIINTLSLGHDTVRYTITTIMGCVDSVFKPFVVNPTPKASPIFSTSQYMCVGDTLILSDTTAAGVWASANPTSININGAGIATASSGGYAPISYIITNQFGCSDTAVLNLFANALPPLTPITGNLNICIGTTTYMNNFLKGGFWSSSDTNIVIINKLGAITGKVAGTAYIYYTVTKSNCTSKDSVQVFIYNAPVIAPISGAKAICNNQSTSLTTTTAGGLWQSVTPRFVSVDTTGDVTALAPGAGIIKYTVSNAFGCSSVALDTLIINDLPKIAAISGRKDVCVAQQTVLSTTPTGGTWSLNNTTLATIDPVKGIVSGIISGQDSVKYIYTDGNGCSDSVYTLLNVDPLPAIAPITGNTNICIKAHTILTDTVPKKGFWVTTDSNIVQVTYEGAIQGISAGTATVRYIVISKQGCTDSVSSLVTVNPLPVINSINGSSLVCVHDSIPLTVSASDPGVWSVQDNTIGTINTATGVFTGVVAGVDSAVYTATNAIGCTNKAAYYIKVNPLPVIDPVQGNTFPVCTLDSIHLFSITQGGVWTSISPAYASINYNTGWLTGVQEGVAAVRYTVTTAYGCKDSITGFATIKGRPKVSWALLKDVCLPDGTATFSSYTTLLPQNPVPITYLWDFGDTINKTGGTTPVITHRFFQPISSTGYNVKLTVTANGCPGDTTILLDPSHIHAQPTAAFITEPSPAEVCIGSSIKFADNSAVNGVNVYRSIWYLGDNTIDTANVLDYQYAYPTTYWAYHRIIDQYGCLSDSAGLLVTIDTFPTLNTGSVRYILVGDSAILSPTISGNIISYNWSPNIYLNNNGIAAPVCTPLNNVTYLVTVTAAGGNAGIAGCSVSDSLKVIALAPFRLPNAFSPNGDGPHDYFDAAELHQYPDVDVKIFDRTGQVVFSSTGTYKPWNGRYNYTGQLVPVGIYYYVIKRGFNLPVLSGSVTIFR